MDFDYIKTLIYSDINSVLDIGAHFGLFTEEMHNVFPNAEYHMIEANIECEAHLKNISFAKYYIELLSDKQKEVTYYMNKKEPTSTGNSYYKELSNHFSDENLQTIKKKTKTLDDMFPEKRFDFIKIDTQGSELDIIRGGSDLIKNTNCILMECSVVPYNENAPLIDEILDYMNKIGFDIQTVVCDHIIENECIQRDILFQR